MTRHLVLALYVLVMVVLIVGVDIALFRNYPWPRLATNIGIVLIFGACYYRFLKPS